MANARILIVEDERLLRMSLAAELGERGYDVVEAETGRAGLHAVAEHTLDLILLDYRLPDTCGLRVLEALRGTADRPPVILMTAYATIETAVHAIKLGAFDYLTKPFEIAELVLRIEKALSTTKLLRGAAHRTARERTTHGLDSLLGECPGIVQLRSEARRVIASPTTTVLVRGASGTGKDVLARAIHVESERAHAPFINITCTAIPDHLLESELFGHEKGAFTDAKERRRGLLEQADGGTVFLDEIGDMSLALQAKLLRFLEEKRFRRVGGVGDLHVDVRVVAATNKDLEAAVRDGTFRADLYYRLKVIELFMPPLRGRGRDVLLLAESFLKRFARELRRPIAELTEAASEALLAYPWPGNVRELRNAIERAVILGSGQEIDLADLPRELSGGPALTPPSGPGSPAPAASGTGRLFTLPASGIAWQAVEDDLVQQALERTGGNQSSAARLLGLSRDQLRYRMERVGILKPKKRAKPAGAQNSGQKSAPGKKASAATAHKGAQGP